MKKDRNHNALKLIKRFDQQLHDLLMSDLRAMRSAKGNIYKHINYDNGQNDLMIAWYQINLNQISTFKIKEAVSKG